MNRLPQPNEPNTRRAAPASTPVPRRKKRRLKRSVRRALVLVVAIGLMLGISAAITALIQNMGGDHLAVSGTSSGTTQSGALPAVPVPDASGVTGKAGYPAVDNTAWNFVGPIADPANAPLITPDARMISLPENGRIDLQYFNNVVFVGDSITQGLEYWNAIPNAHYCAYVGASPRSIYSGEEMNREDGESEVPLEALAAYKPDNVYVLMGTNALVNMDDESMLAYYDGMLDAIKATLDPTVEIYVQSVTPVLKTANDALTAERIKGVNDQLAKMAFEKGCHYLDLHEALADDDGWLRGNYAAEDGYHFQPSGYRAWVEYLVTHTAYNRRHANLYLEGSQYYSPEMVE